ncbi:MAG: hypothetical protein H6868_02205 [Rhodospirillales bacterium]|nr:hypothetical protein [Rhodospirillales bacterium]
MSLMPTNIFQHAARKSCTVGTTLNEAEFSSSRNPMRGQSAVVALTAQDIYGGTLERLTIEFEESHNGKTVQESHYANIIEGRPIDFSWEEYTRRPGCENPRAVDSEQISREQLLADQKIADKYMRFKREMYSKLSPKVA